MLFPQGSLIARIIFQPIEETSRVFFSKTLAPVLSQQSKASDEEAKRAIFSARRALALLLLLQINLTLLIVAFGPPHLPILLKYALPKRYLATSAPQILGAYIYYIPAMALNGVLEAFLSSAATSEDLSKQSRWMAAFSINYVASGFLFTVKMGMGDVGLIWANVVNSGMRAGYGWVFAEKWFGSRSNRIGREEIFPPVLALVVFVISASMTRYSARLFPPGSVREDVIHIGVGGLIGLACLTIWYVVKLLV